MENNSKNDGNNGFIEELSESLGAEVSDEIENPSVGSEENSEEEYSESDFENVVESDSEEFAAEEEMEENKPKRRGLKIFGIVMLVLLLIIIFFAGTKPGRKIALGWVAKYVHSSVQVDNPVNGGSLNNAANDGDAPYVDITLDEEPVSNTDGGAVSGGENAENWTPRSEDYVKTYLIFGIEEINGGANTDAIMLVSVNTKDNTIKLTSILRDTYVEIPGWNNNKINAAYSRGAKGSETRAEARYKGSTMLINVIQNTFDVAISGYACVNFAGFEKVIDRLGGIDIQLGEAEAKYLNKTNYISDPANRNVVAGWNHLNGNQALGYCRVRKVVTLGGANNDYGRTVRQRRVINAIIQKFKSTSVVNMIPIMTDCLGVVSTNLTEEQMTDALVDIVENSTYTVETMRLPVDELFTDSGKAGINNGSSNITYTLIMGDHKAENIKRFHEFLFLDGKEEQ